MKVYIRTTQRVTARQAVIQDFFNELPPGVTQGLEGFDLEVLVEGQRKPSQRIPIFDGDWLIYTEDGTPQNVVSDAFFQAHYAPEDATSVDYERRAAELEEETAAVKRVMQQMRDEIVNLNATLDAERARTYAAKRAVAAVLRVPAQHDRNDGARVILLDPAMLARLAHDAQESTG